MLTESEKMKNFQEPKHPKTRKHITFAQISKVRANATEITNDSDDWVRYGDDNDYFEFLASLYQNSPTNNACIFGTMLQVYGRGLYPINVKNGLKNVAYFATKVKQIDVQNIALEFKLYGMAAMSIHVNPDGSLKSIEHWPMHTLRMGKCNENGEIDAVYYCADWNNTKSNDVERIPLVGYERGAKHFMHIIKSYFPARFYYTPPSYAGGILWSALEWEVSKFYNSYVKKGMYPMFMINFNNGTPTEAEQDEIETKISEKYQGTEGNGFILAFNESKENAATLEGVQIPDAPQQFEFLSNESTRKIMLAHVITSPLLLGIRDTGGGLGNNANELRESYLLFQRNVIQPMQRQIIDAFEYVLAQFDFFAPLEFVPNITSAELILRSHNVNLADLRNDLVDKQPDTIDDRDSALWMNYLDSIGEIVDDDLFEIVSTNEVVDAVDEQNQYFDLHREYQLATTPSAKYENPQQKSDDGDAGLYKIRYRYKYPKSDNSRTFCKYMTTRSSNGIVYRLEDIIQMSDDGVNGQFAPRGESNYNIWLWKGGCYCHHAWERVVYFRKRNPDGTFKSRSKTKSMENDKRVSVESAIDAGVPDEIINPDDIDQAQTRPIDTETRGKLN